MTLRSLSILEWDLSARQNFVLTTKIVVITTEKISALHKYNIINDGKIFFAQLNFIWSFIAYTVFLFCCTMPFSITKYNSIVFFLMLWGESFLICKNVFSQRQHLFVVKNLLCWCPILYNKIKNGSQKFTKVWVYKVVQQKRIKQVSGYLMLYFRKMLGQIYLAYRSSTWQFNISILTALIQNVIENK